MNPGKEPTAWGGAITALAVAGIPLLRAFGVNIDESQSNAILGFLAAASLRVGCAWMAAPPYRLTHVNEPRKSAGRYGDFRSVECAFGGIDRNVKTGASVVPPVLITHERVAT